MSAPQHDAYALGIGAALIGPFAMVIGLMVWDNSWTGSAFSLNLYKCTLASLGFALLCVVTTNAEEEPWLSPAVFTPTTVGFLMVSSTIGILIGDWTWLEGMRILGARKVIIMDSLKPFLAALLGRIFLQERLKPAAFGGLVCTVIGVLLVGLERDEQLRHDDGDEHNIPRDTRQSGGCEETDSLLVDEHVSYAEKRRITRKRSSQGDDPSNDHTLFYGIFMSLANVVLHTLGALLMKTYGVGMSTWEINLIRFGFASAVMLAMSSVLQMRDWCSASWPDTMNAADCVTQNNAPAWYRLPKISTMGWVRVTAGVAMLSFAAPALLNYAMFQIELALLLTLESVGPIYSVPLACVLEGEQPTARAWLGALLAVAGIVVLSFWGTLEA